MSVKSKAQILSEYDAAFAEDDLIFNKQAPAAALDAKITREACFYCSYSPCRCQEQLDAAQVFYFLLRSPFGTILLMLCHFRSPNAFRCLLRRRLTLKLLKKLVCIAHTPLADVRSN